MPEPKPVRSRLRLRVILITLGVGIPACFGLWWISPAGVQHRRMEQAARWVSSVEPTTRADARFARVEFHVNTSETTYVQGQVDSWEDMQALTSLLEHSEPPGPVSLDLEVAGDLKHVRLEGRKWNPERSPKP